jgi:hypothetical protein
MVLAVTVCLSTNGRLDGEDDATPAKKNALKDCTEALGTGTSRFLTRAPEDALDVGELAEYGGGKLDRVWSSGGVEAWD